MSRKTTWFVRMTLRETGVRNQKDVIGLGLCGSLNTDHQAVEQVTIPKCGGVGPLKGIPFKTR